MSAARSLLSEDQFLCSICLDVFTDPVTTPCGHNFCKNCITTNWDINVRCMCPMCKKIYYTRPVLQVNTFVSEMVAHFRQSSQQRASSSSSQQHVAKPGEVPCDACTGTKLKALKSCLVCLVSYCETHLEPHLTASGLRRHQLIDPVDNLEGRMCTKHDKLLELFCKTDQTCVCMLCTILDHKAHEVIPLKDECEGKKAELGKTEVKLKQMIRERRLKIKELKHSVNVSKENSDRERAEGVHIFTKMKEVIEKYQVEVIKTITERHRMIQKQADGFIKELKQEISELVKRSAQLDQLSNSEDHLHLIQNLPSLNTVPPTKPWTGVRVRPPSYEAHVRIGVIQLLGVLQKLYMKAELKKVQQSAVDVTLDPETANPRLILSDDGKQVHHGYAEGNLLDNPERFSTALCVLGKQIVSPVRFYFEVQVKGKTNWVLGVARESINRKGVIGIGPKNGYWTLSLRNEKEYCALTDTVADLSLRSKPEKVGVLAQYEQGLVSFYDVDAATHIYTFTDCSFTGKLLPVFSPGLDDGGKNSAPLIICPVVPTQ